MQTINLVVVDFVGRDTSSFIGDLNEYFARVPEREGRRHTRRDQLQDLLEQWETFARIEVDETLHLAIFLAPLSASDAHQKPEYVWEVLADNAMGCVFLVDHHAESWPEAAGVIARFRELASVPEVLVVHDQSLKDVDTEQMRQTLSLAADVPTLAYRHVGVLRSVMKDILVGLLRRIAGDVDWQERLR